jgi:hypothetical protein
MPRAWVRRTDVLWRRSLDAVVLLADGSDDPLVLAGSGPDVWELLAEPRTLDDLGAVLAGRYDAAADVIREEVEPVLDQLVGANLLQKIET